MGHVLNCRPTGVVITQSDLIGSDSGVDHAQVVSLTPVSAGPVAHEIVRVVPLAESGGGSAALVVLVTHFALSCRAASAARCLDNRSAL